MSNSIISVENLSKRYLIGRNVQKGDGLRHALEGALRAPLAMMNRNERRKNAKTEEFWAVRDLSLKVSKGEMLGIIGRNGAGKSTLLKLLSRITEPTTGRIRLRGRVASLLEVGTGFHPELTGRENIFLNGSILGMTRAEIKRRFDEIVAFAEIDKFLDTPVKRYSSGMYVRLAFAVAAHLEPEILIVDEVLAVGDAEFQKKCLGKMGDVSTKEGRTVILVSHQMPAIQNLCTRCVLLDHGKVVFDGRTADTIEHYLTKAAALTSTKLKDRKDREGAGDVIVSDVAFLSSTGERVREISSGQDLVIKMTFKSVSGTKLHNCRFSLTILKDGSPMILLSSDLVDKHPISVSDDGEIEFLLPALPLSGGRYHISTYIGSHGNVTQDWVDDAALLDVVDGDYYGTGRLYPDGWQGQVVLVRHSWKIRVNGKDSPAPHDETGSIAGSLGHPPAAGWRDGGGHHRSSDQLDTRPV
jgi:lipopolysaccharide transport system ATP-binding protein